MNELKLTFLGESVLREKAKDVESIDANIIETLDEMEKLMHKHHGRGLAAPQVGILKRMLVFADTQNKIIYKAINPKILSRSETMICMNEGCLSIQGPDGPEFADVDRPESVICEWQSENGEHVVKPLSGLLARVIQHEIDHLDGILFIDYLSIAKREMVMRKVKKRK